jgi:hypothetical protein
MATHGQKATLADTILCATSLVAVGILAVAALLYFWK